MNIGGHTEEVRAKYNDAMGQELGELFCAISAELIWARILWAQFRILFGEKPSRIDLLNKAAPLFFGILQDALFADTLLAIARMVDPIDSGKGKENLTILKLPKIITDSNFKNEVKDLVQQARTAAEFARDRRNRRVAHLDFDLHLGQNAQPLAPVSRKNVEDVLAALANVLNCIEVKYCGSETAYEVCSPVPGDALCLLNVVRNGIEFQRDRLIRRARGEWIEDVKRQEPL